MYGAKVTFTHSVTVFIKADTKKDLEEFMTKNTPNNVATSTRMGHRIPNEDYSEKIECEVGLEHDFDIDISSEIGKTALPYHE